MSVKAGDSFPGSLFSPGLKARRLAARGREAGWVGIVMGTTEME
jgi:hypothetical protein